MKKRFFILNLFIILSLLILIGCTTQHQDISIDKNTISSENKESCPFGIQHDSYPGQCSRYIDKNNDSICDYSE